MPEEVRRVLAVAEELVDEGELEPHAAVGLRLAAVTGVRRSELAALRWDDLNGDRLTVNSSIAIIRHGQGRTKRTPTLRDDPTKTANRRTLTLDAGTLEQLEALRRHFAGLGPWMLSVGDRPVNPERIAVWWRRARDRAGVADRWRLHDLRHWSATTATAKG